jgi:alpha-methylacyl-CoA racemase
MAGPLAGVSVVELAGLGPAPFCGMMLADLGAHVVRVDRVGAGEGITGRPVHDLHNRGKESIAVDLKQPRGVEVVLTLVEKADILIEGFRPGVTERLGLGPDRCLARNPALVYGRMTGWGQDGPLASTAGHDIDYIALSGVLHAIGSSEEPIPPLNLVGDFGGGGVVLAFGVLAALTHSRETGEGQVIDAAMTDGSALLMTSYFGFVEAGWWDPAARRSNLLDGGAPFYTVYETSDGRHVAVGALEPQFFSTLIDGLGLEVDTVPAQNDRDRWPEMREMFASVFRTRTLSDWATHFAGTDACVAPVLSIEEAPSHLHNAQRGTFIEVDGVLQPGPAPRFSATVPAVLGGPALPGADTDAVLERLGFSPVEIGKLKGSGAVA